MTATIGGGSAFTQALESIWQALQQRAPELPDVVIFPRPGDMVDADVTFLTLAHVAAHMLAATRGQTTTSRQGRYHNMIFLGAARELGLDYGWDGPDAVTGFAAVTLTKASRVAYRGLIRDLKTVLKAYRNLPTLDLGAKW